MKAYARPPYGVFWGALLTIGTFTFRVHQSAVNLGHVTGTNAAFTGLGLVLMLALLAPMARMRRFRIDGDRFEVTRPLGPGRLVAYPLADIEMLRRHRNGLTIVLKGGVLYGIPEVYWGAKQMIRLLLSDDVRGPGFTPAREVVLQLRR